MRLEQFNNKQGLFESLGLRDPYFVKWEKEIHPYLIEAAMTPDQIQQLFGQVEKTNRTALGKGMDAVGAAKDKISDAWFNKFGGMLQNSKPVEKFDAKFEEIKSKIAAKYPDIAAKLAKYGEFAKNSPNLHKFLLAIAGSVAAALGVAAAGGITAGALAVGTGTAVAVGIVNIADRLLQGQKASTAIGRGATAGLVAGITAAGAAKLADLGKTLAAQIGVMKGAGEGVEKLSIIRDAVGTPGMPGFEGGIQIAGKTEDIAKLRDLWDQFGKLAWDYKPGTDPSALYGPYKEFAGLVAQMKDPAYIDGLQLVAAQQQQAIEWVNSAFTAINGAANLAATAGAATAGQAAAGAGEAPAAPGAPAPTTPTPTPTPTPAPTAPAPKRQSLKQKLAARQTNEYIDRDLTVRMWMLNEMINKPRGGVRLTEAGIGQALGKGASWLANKAKGLTTKTTAADLTAAWQAAGSPTDSEEVAKVLRDAGVGDDIIGKTFTDMGVPAPGAPATDPATDANVAAPGGDTTGTAALGTGLIKDWKQLRDVFEKFQDADGSMVPQVRGVLRDILLTAFATVESKKYAAFRKLLEADLQKSKKRLK
jgi:hypothetical protein